MDNNHSRDYWRANLKLVGWCLVAWFIVSYGFGILLVEPLNQVKVFGFKLGFWFAQQGSLFAFLLIVFFYAWRMNALDKRFDVHEED
jgi:putative solute:sodium symporter small subunit